MRRMRWIRHRNSTYLYRNSQRYERLSPSGHNGGKTARFHGTIRRGGTCFSSFVRFRSWGPADRVTALNRAYFEKLVDGAPDNEPVRIEVELVFRSGAAAATAAETEVIGRIVEAGGLVIHRSRRAEFAYHALLVDLPASEIRRIANLNPASLAGADPIVSIVPQSVGTPIEAGDRVPDDIARVGSANPDPIAAVFDAVPVQAHPLLAGRLTIDDPDNLEARAVGPRIHGTAMASLAVHGDLNDLASPINRRVYFRPVMFAPAFGDEIFDSARLVIDLVVEAVMRMRQNGGTNVVVVNLSLGDRTKPFGGKISTWARALDYLAYTYGILFLVSAGNVSDGVPLGEFADQAAFQAAAVDDKEKAIFRSLDAVKSDRRLLAPADSVNALTIGSWQRIRLRRCFPEVVRSRPMQTRRCRIYRLALVSACDALRNRKFCWQAVGRGYGLIPFPLLLSLSLITFRHAIGD